MRKRKEKGITLVVLVVTIIVLLILAGVSVAMLTGNNGIVNQAQDAKSQTEKSQIEEKTKEMVLQSMDKRGYVQKDKLLKKLNTLPGEKEITEIEGKIHVVYPEYGFEIDVESGDVNFKK